MVAHQIPGPKGSGSNPASLTMMLFWIITYNEAKKEFSNFFFKKHNCITVMNKISPKTQVRIRARNVLMQCGISVCAKKRCKARYLTL